MNPNSHPHHIDVNVNANAKRRIPNSRSKTSNFNPLDAAHTHSLDKMLRFSYLSRSLTRSLSLPPSLSHHSLPSTSTSTSTPSSTPSSTHASPTTVRGAFAFAARSLHTTLSPAESHEFQAETRKLLDIVAKSLYSDKKIFVRELISNASDALEKMRYAQTAHSIDVDRELKIDISFDEKEGTLTIADTGIGMDKEDLMNNLGTIARSGTASFVDDLAKGKDASPSSDAASNVIGKFGVGFYSAFIVGDHVTVTTRKAGEDSGWVWSSDGTGSYEIEADPNAPAGTTIVIHLNNDSKDFASKYRLEEIVKQYSNFVTFPISVDGSHVNVIEPLWMKPKSQISDQDHLEFYQFIADSYDEPAFKLQFEAEVPVAIKSIFYFPQTHFEYKFGSGRLEPGVQLYSRRVLIDPKPEALLPEWLRFVKGVVDSEDIPLNLSREFSQDDALMANLNKILTKRILRTFQKELKADRAAYTKWFSAFGNFLKEGVCSSETYKNDLGSLLLFATSASEDPDARRTLDEIVAAAPETQDKLYYVVAPTRELADASPYMDAFKAKNTEVILLDEPVDEFVMRHLKDFKGKKLVSIESNDVGEEFSNEAPGDKDGDAKDGDSDKADGASSSQEESELMEWIQSTLEDKVTEVRKGKRLTSAPALIVEHDSATMRQMQRMVGARVGVADMDEKYALELNFSSPVISRLTTARVSNPDLAVRVAQQIFDNAMISAGLLEDPRVMVKRLDALLADALSNSADQ